jgi:hypothetical protein
MHPAAPQPHPLAGWSGSLTRGVQIVLQTVLCTLSQEHSHVNSCRKTQHHVLECPRVSPSVSECTFAPDGQEIFLCDALFERPVSSPASDDHLDHDLGDSSDARAWRTHVHAMCLPSGWRPGIGTKATPVHAGALAGQQGRCMCFPIAVRTSWLHTSLQICCHWCLACMSCVTPVCDLICDYLRVRAVSEHSESQSHPLYTSEYILSVQYIFQACNNPSRARRLAANTIA